MRRLLLGTALVAAGSLAGLSAAAQDLFYGGDDQTVIRVTEFIGHPVYHTETAVTGEGIPDLGPGQQWNEIGNVSDVLMTRDGNISAVVVDVGSFLGTGEREVAILPAALYFVNNEAADSTPGDYRIVVTAGRSVFESAPAYDRGMGTASTTGTSTASGVVPMTDNNADSTGTGNSTNNTSDIAGSNVDNSTATTGGDSGTDVPALQAAEGSAEGGISDRQTAQANEGGSAEGAQTGTAGQGATGSDGALAAGTGVVNLEELDGVQVQGADGENLGEISGVIASETGTPTHVILDMGGFLGFGQKSVAIEAASLQIERAEGSDEIRAVLPMTREALDALPTVN